MVEAGFMGTFGVAFNNFSVKNIRNRKAWQPFPSGDGQTLAIRLQTSSFYNTTSFSFVEPWFGGKRACSIFCNFIVLYNSV